MKMRTLVFAASTVFLLTLSLSTSFGESKLMNNEEQKSIPVAQYYEGGETALLADIQKELVYPIMAKKSRKQGTCVIKLKLNADGTTDNFQIVSELGYGTGQEAMRVVQTLKFKAPGYDQNHNVPVKFSLK